MTEVTGFGDGLLGGLEGAGLVGEECPGDEGVGVGSVFGVGFGRFGVGFAFDLCLCVCF
ncbi:MAG TPA: hypothetical protein VN767_11835 [Streptosporangiaceae bacterium]|nr:hypothetical protein [Streptosporangiaceae bacterium]